MDGIQGAILRIKLRRLDRWTAARRSVAAQFDRMLAGSGVVTPAVMPYARHAYHVYGVRTPDREALRRTLSANGVQSAIHYPIPVHLQPAYADLGFGRGAFPEAERAADEELSLPIYPELTPTSVEVI